MVNPCYQYLPSACWAKINSGAILLLSGEELAPLDCSIFSWFLKVKRCNYPIQLSVHLPFLVRNNSWTCWSVITNLDMDNSEFLKISDQVEEGDAVSAWTEGEALENPPVEELEVPQWQEEL